MARNLGKTIQNHLGGGLVTEATGLNFPPNAVVNTSNCIFKQDQSVYRRPGFNYEASHVDNITSTAGNVINEFVWLGPAGLGNTNFVVVQNGSTIFFYNVVPTQPLSAGLFPTTINLESYKVAGAPSTATVNASFASGYGYLFIAHPYCDPIYVTYSVSGGSITFTQVILMQRDLSGIAETGVAIQNRPSALTSNHVYNLFNQGWIYYVTPWDSYINDIHGIAGVYPSNTDIWWTYKDQTGVFNPSQTFVNVSLGNAQAPQGSFLLPCFNQDRSAAVAALATSLNYHGNYSTLPGLTPVTSSYFRPSAVAFFAGRVFFAGVNFGNFANQIYYSQIIQSPANINQMYQADDPTGDDTQVTDLLPSDGGVLIEPEIGQIYKMYPMAYSLIIFASNGVWAISGNTGSGFTATDFSVSKISTIGMLSPTSFIDFDGIPIWWNQDSIYTLGSGGVSPNGNLGAAVTSLTDSTIKTFFDSIPAQSKLTAKGSYNRSTFSITWLYTSFVPASLTATYQYDSALIMNTLTKAWYTWTIPNTSANYLSGLVTVYTQGANYSLVNVIDKFGANVVDQFNANVQSAIGGVAATNNITKFIVQYPVSGQNSISFAELNDLTYNDFGVGFTSSALTGYTLDGQALSKFQTPYVIFYVNNSQASAVQIQASWNFANSNSTNRISYSENLQSEGGNYDYQGYRRKIRGSGVSLQIGFVSIANQPFDISGWAIEVGENTQA